jgi:hypothetical protein
MYVRFAAPELKQIDALRCEALALPLFRDERPLSGALGLIDWRLCGFLSRMLVAEHIAGDSGETVLVPARPKLSFDKLFLFGLGPRAEFDAGRGERAIDHMLRTLARARVRTTALVLPGRNTSALSPPRAMELFIAVTARHEDHDELVLLETAEAQREMEPVVERERRRARAQMTS